MTDESTTTEQEAPEPTYPKKRPPPDTGPEVPEQPVVKVGQVWEEVDPRGGRTVTVMAVGAATASVMSAGKSPQIYTANLSHFGSPNGYKLVQDVP
jgi:hypothetical protein